MVWKNASGMAEAVTGSIRTESCNELGFLPDSKSKDDPDACDQSVGLPALTAKQCNIDIISVPIGSVEQMA